MEMGNYGDVAKYAGTLKVNLSKNISIKYIQFVFDFYIQVRWLLLSIELGRLPLACNLHIDMA